MYLPSLSAARDYLGGLSTSRIPGQEGASLKLLVLGSFL